MTMKDSTYLSHLVRRLKWSDIDEKYVAELVKTARAAIWSFAAWSLCGLS